MYIDVRDHLRNSIQVTFSLDSTFGDVRNAVNCCLPPGFVVTEFGPGMDMLKKMGGVPVELSCAGLVKAMDGLTLETTGRYMTVPKDGSDPTDFGPGW